MIGNAGHELFELVVILAVGIGAVVVGTAYVLFF